jgi:flagellar basal body-associated protein FliL
MKQKLTEEQIKKSNKRIRILLIIAALLFIGYFIVKWFILKKPGLGW